MPLYHQVEQDLRRLIDSGHWQPGQRIPSEKGLEEMYGASRITIRRALQDLAEQGLLVREPGRGTFVREPALTAEPRSVTSFTEEMDRLGLRADSRMVSIGLEPAEQPASDRLRLEKGDPVVVVARLRLADGKPLGIQRAWLPAARFPDLERVDLAHRSLYAHLKEAYRVVPSEADELFRVCSIEGENARLLQVLPGACGFLVERLTFDDRGPFEYVVSVMRGDRYRVHLGLRYVT
jgi:GntR family transcriptional regulator